MKRAAAYARVSTSKQSETSIETQFQRIEEFCKLHNYVIVDYFFDKMSGAEVNRPAFQKMIKNALEGKYDVIIVEKYDRFFRDDIEDRRYTRMLEANGVLVLSVSEGIDPSSLTGKLLRMIMSDFNWFYRENLKDEIKKKSVAVARRGYWMGGIPPYGYEVQYIKDPEGRRRAVLAIKEDEAPVVQQIFQMFAKGLSYRKIAQELNKQGFTTRKGRPWAPATIREILHNEKYGGIYYYNRGTKHNYHAKRSDTIYVPGAVPAIVDKETFRKVRERLQSYRTPRMRKHNYFLTGIIFCGRCGEPMHGSSGGIPRYACKNKHTVSAAKIEKATIEYINRKILAIDNINFEVLAEELNRMALENDAHIQEKIKELRKQLNKVNEEINNV
ncbi:hypothetical protein DRN97_08210, partial [Methanosarcinales archaeon]